MTVDKIGGAVVAAHLNLLWKLR